ncbi:hypothetical protein [Streptomyces sp. NPDC002746]
MRRPLLPRCRLGRCPRRLRRRPSSRLSSLPGVGQALRLQIFASAGIGEERRLQDLGARQRERLLQSVAHHGGQPATSREASKSEAGDRSLG